MTDSMTIAKAIKNRKTIAGKLEVCRVRATRYAVIEKGSSPDFDTESEIENFVENQKELRILKRNIAVASVSNTIDLPEALRVGEPWATDRKDGKISLYEAILLRDDLKSELALWKSLTEISTEKERVYHRDSPEPPEKVRTFNFGNALEEIDHLQDLVDELDSRIQYADNTVKI